MDTIETKLAAALEGIVAKDAEITEARASIEKVAAENMELTTKVAELTTALNGVLADKTALLEKVAALESSAVSASEEAAKIAASVGVAPVESAPAGDETPKLSVLEQYLALSGVERANFFAANKAAIYSAMRG